MLDSNFLRTFLRVNEAPEDMSDRDVCRVLEIAGWSQDEIKAGLLVLRKKADTSSKQYVGSFRPDMEFSSTQLSKLLGVDLVIDPAVVRGKKLARFRPLRTILDELIYAAGVIVVLVLFGICVHVISVRYFNFEPFASFYWFA